MALLGKLFGSKKVSRKALIIGLDGVPYTTMTKFMADGLMPNTSALVKTGTLRRMTTSLPEVSSFAWTSFMTGVNPGRHGKRSIVINVPSTYPARELNGILV